MDVGAFVNGNGADRLNLRKSLESLQFTAVDAHTHAVEGGLHPALDGTPLGLNARSNLVLNSRQLVLDLPFLTRIKLTSLLRLNHGNGIVLELHHDGDLGPGVEDVLGRPGPDLPGRGSGDQAG